MSIAAAEATLLDCLAPRTAVYARGTKKLKFRDPARPQPLAVTLRLAGGTWKVASIRPGDSRVVGCAG